MKKSVILSSLLSLLSLSVAAQLSGNGYYRVQNFVSQRYISIVDNKSQGLSVSTTRYDVDAIITVPKFDNIVNDPSTVMYIEKGADGYILRAQSTDSYVLTGRYLTITAAGGGTYQASGTYKGQMLVLADEAGADDEPFGMLQVNGTGAYRNWYIKPVNQADGQYFGLKPEVTAGSRRFTSFYASFPYTFQSSGMKAYTVTKVDGDLAVWQELTGTVPQGTAVIVECAGAAASDNRLNLVDGTLTPPAGNLLRGVYFDNMNPTLGTFHYNYVSYDASTMRVLGVTKAGKPGLVKYGGTILPRNRAYLTVPAGSPDEITLVTQAEYEAERAKDDVVVTAQSYSRQYGEANPSLAYTTTGHELKGTPVLTCAATATSPVGTYDIVVSRGTVTNSDLTLVNGTLTVTAAPLTVTAQSYTIKQNEPLPQLAVSYTGFKNGETASVLTRQPTVTTNAPADKTPGTYTITVAGAEATNYDIAYVAGTLTITEADPITVTAQDATMNYGDDVPELTYTVSGGTLSETGLVLKTTATKTSDAGIYAITVERGTVTYPNLRLVAGTLTVEKAPLTVSVGNYERFVGEANPVFVLIYDGFRNGDTEQVFTTLPTATTTATADSPQGEYAIEVSGGEARNYRLAYIGGTLTVMATDAIAEVALTQPADVYTVTGTKVRAQATSLDGLPRGVYIVNGRKVARR